MKSSIRRDVMLAIGAFVILALLPTLFPGKAVTDFVVRVAAFGIYATSLNLLIGYTGLVSFGHGLFFGLGAYSFALMMQKLGASVPLAFALTILISASVALVVGAICVRLKEIYFSFLTLAFQMLLYSLIVAWTPITGGDQGLTGGLPRPTFLGIDLAQPHHLYLFCCAVMVISLYLMWHLTRSPFGYTLRMIRDNPNRVGFLGVKVWRMRLLVFVIAGAFGAIGGILMSLFVSSAYPDFAYWTISGEAVFMIMMGGISVFFGPLVGAVILLLLNDFVTKVTEHYGLVLGIIILMFALGLRKGVMGFLVDFVRERRVASAKRIPHQA